MNAAPETPAPLLIGGEAAKGHGPILEAIDPATGRVSARYQSATSADVDAAVKAARESFAHGTWRTKRPHERATVLFEAARRIAEASETLAQLQMSQNGKALRECRAQAKAAAATFRYFASVCETMEGELTTPRGDYLSMIVHEPIGVAALITPWNSPMTMEAQKLAPALAAGNSVILKPSEITPGTGLALGRIVCEAGLPPGVLNVLSGTGLTVGDPLVRHKDVGMISFTGGTATGRAIARIAAERLIPVALELGGKSPHIVFADADVDRAVEGVFGGIFDALGQSCVAGSRLFVERPLYRAFVDRLIERANTLKLGPPADPTSDQGPLASFGHRERVERYVALARADGGRVLAGGERPSGAPFDHGAYYQPTIIDRLANDARACREEIFGPVLCVLPFDHESDLIEQANDTAYGLAAGLWTRDVAKAWRVARRLEAGTVWINTYRELSIATPFGGMKESGLGREKGRQGVRLYTATKSIYLSLAGGI